MDGKEEESKIIMYYALGIFFLIGIHHTVQAAPIAVMIESTFNFGSAVEGSKIEHDFVLENNGTEPLVIEKISTG